MRLPEDAIRRFDQEGYLLFPTLFRAEEVAALRRPLPEILRRDGAEVVREENNGRAAKMVFGLHFTDPPFRRAALHPRMVGPAEQLVRERVHVFQSRVNPKLPGGGAGWGWHQDFNQWLRFDGVEEPRAVLSAIFLDDVDDGNAPLTVIPGSHARHFHVPDAMEIPAEMLEGMTERARPLTGPAGTVVFFHALLVHGSAPNTSSRARAMFYVVYNPVTNTRIAARRARHHCSTDFTPVEPLADDCLLPVRTRPFAPPCHLAGRERELLLEVLESGEWSSFRAANEVDDVRAIGTLPSADAETVTSRFLGGRRVRALEARFSERAGARFAVAANSATSALVMALGAVGIQPGDEVLVPPMTFHATATAPLAWGGVPVFVDVDERTYCMDPADAARKITPRTRAIIPVHLAGNAADLDALLALARRHSLKVIEDAAQALGVRYRGRQVGSLGDAGVFSLTEMKTITCGEGGVLVTDDPAIALKARLIRNHGESATGDDWTDEELCNVVGMNFRLTEIQAALALAQLEALDERNARRHENACWLIDRLRGIDGLVAPQVVEGSDPIWYIVKWRWLGELSRDAIAAGLAAEGIPITPGYPRLLHRHPLFVRRFGAASCPVAEAVNEQMLWFGAVNAPNTIRDMEDVVRAFEKVVGR